MKKYDVHVILGDKFHSVVIECAGVRIENGIYMFGTNGNIIAWYPVQYTVIEEHKENITPSGSGVRR